jgi:hypothetical protein
MSQKSKIAVTGPRLPMACESCPDPCDCTTAEIMPKGISWGAWQRPKTPFARHFYLRHPALILLGIHFCYQNSTSGCAAGEYLFLVTLYYY